MRNSNLSAVTLSSAHQTSNFQTRSLSRNARCPLPLHVLIRERSAIRLLLLGALKIALLVNRRMAALHRHHEESPSLLLKIKRMKLSSKRRLQAYQVPSSRCQISHNPLGNVKRKFSAQVRLARAPRRPACKSLRCEARMFHFEFVDGAMFSLSSFLLFISNLRMGSVTEKLVMLRSERSILFGWEICVLWLVLYISVDMDRSYI
jgi:hypothetical protein